MKRNRIVLKCLQCGNDCERTPSELKRRKAGPWCSWACWKLAHPPLKSYPKIGRRHAHRIEAEKKLGRALLPGEIVHHEDHVRQNFNQDNLKVISSQSEHALLHGFNNHIPTKEERERTSERFKGKRLSEDRKIKLSEIRKAWWSSQSLQARQRRGLLMRNARNL